MSSKWWRYLLVVLIFLTACQSAPEQISPTPTQTKTLVPTITPTVIWFPPTATLTPFPTQEVTPTPDFLDGIGPLLLEDDFSTPTAWDRGTTAAGQASVINQALTLAVTDPRGFLFSTRRGPVLADFYAEISIDVSLCQGSDEFGLLLRVTETLDYYRYSLSCDGQVRLDRIWRGGAAALQPWIFGGAPPGAPIRTRIGAWMKGDEIRLFVNGQHQFTLRDPTILSGSLGVFARAADDTAVTVSFSDLEIYELDD